MGGERRNGEWRAKNADHNPNIELLINLDIQI
jgi:hypothetical protein